MPVRFPASGSGIRLGTTGKPSTAGTVIWWQRVMTANDNTSRTIFFAERDAAPYAVIRVATSGINNNIVEGFQGLQVSLSPQPNQTDWYMWALVWNGTGTGSVRLYTWRVGDADGTYGFAESTNSTTGDIGSAIWGFGNFGGEYRNAQYCFVKIWSEALTLSQLQAERVKGKPVRLTNLNRVHRLLTNTDTSDDTGNGRVLTFNGTVDTEGTEPVPWDIATNGVAAQLAYHRRLAA